MDLTLDLDILFAEFGVDATIGGATVRGFFDNGFGTAFSGMVGGTDPTFTCASSQISGLVDGGTVVINAVTYTASSDPEADGTGISTVRLRK